jgi:hypothetical protein
MGGAGTRGARQDHGGYGSLVMSRLMYAATAGLSALSVSVCQRSRIAHRPTPTRRVSFSGR